MTERKVTQNKRYYGSTELSMVKMAQAPTRRDLARIFIKSNLSKTQSLAKLGFYEVNFNTLA